MLGLGQVPVPFIACPLRFYQNLKKIRNGLEHRFLLISPCLPHYAHLGRNTFTLTLNQPLYSKQDIYSSLHDLDVYLDVIMTSNSRDGVYLPCQPRPRFRDAHLKVFWKYDCLTPLLSLIDTWADSVF